jgi:SAM-dependent methyltransferase
MHSRVFIRWPIAAVRQSASSTAPERQALRLIAASFPIFFMANWREKTKPLDLHTDYTVPKELVPAIADFRWGGSFWKPSDVLAVMDLQREDRFLDVGCGLGEHVVYAARWGVNGKTGVTAAYGVDAVMKLVKGARILSQAAEHEPESMKRQLDVDPKTRAIGGSIGDYVNAFANTAEKLPDASNAFFFPMNPFSMSLKTDSVDKVQCLSVASYVEGELKRRNLLKELIRVAREGGRIHVSAFGYPREGQTHEAGILQWRKEDGEGVKVDEEIADVAGRLGAKLKRIGDTPTGQHGGVFLVEHKPKRIDRTVFTS